VDVDVVVVGGGVVGLAVADALHRRGAEVACLEAGVPGAGQSAGRTRIFRHSHEDPTLVREAIGARALWAEWEERAGRRLLGDEGALLVRDDPEGDLERLRAAGASRHHRTRRRDPRPPHDRDAGRMARGPADRRVRGARAT
jgi:sarcosine oxidase